ncbi:MAG: polysaccharide deacetylase family protein [Armatimonadota bacterium]
MSFASYLSGRLLPSRSRRSRAWLAAAVASRSGLLSALRAARRNRGLLALTYHRIGDPDRCLVDGNNFSSTEKELAAHLALLQRWSRITTLEEVEAHYAAGRAFSGSRALITFDDAYRDNYARAFPALRRTGASAVFFVPTGLIEQRHLPWWDRIAYAVKQCRSETLRPSYPGDLEVKEVRTRPAAAVWALLRRFKSDAALDKERFVAAIEEAAGARAADDDRVGELFASWDELREMARGGMEIASHTHTHRLLAHLPLHEQREELGRSREILREKLGVTARAVAYPVGGRGHFNAETRTALRETGYRLGFSHYGGWNPRAADAYDIRRARVDFTVDRVLVEAAVSLPSYFAR